MSEPKDTVGSFTRQLFSELEGKLLRLEILLGLQNDYLRGHIDDWTMADKREDARVLERVAELTSVMEEAVSDANEVFQRVPVMAETA